MAEERGSVRAVGTGVERAIGMAPARDGGGRCAGIARAGGIVNSILTGYCPRLLFGRREDKLGFERSQTSRNPLPCRKLTDSTASSSKCCMPTTDGTTNPMSTCFRGTRGVDGHRRGHEEAGMRVENGICRPDGDVALLRVEECRALAHPQLRVRFDNGEEREVDLSPLLERPAFRPLADDGRIPVVCRRAWHRDVGRRRFGHRPGMAFRPRNAVLGSRGGRLRGGTAAGRIWRGGLSAESCFSATTGRRGDGELMDIRWVTGVARPTPGPPPGISREGAAPSAPPGESRDPCR